MYSVNGKQMAAVPGFLLTQDHYVVLLNISTTCLWAHQRIYWVCRKWKFDQLVPKFKSSRQKQLSIGENNMSQVI